MTSTIPFYHSLIKLPFYHNSPRPYLYYPLPQLNQASVTSAVHAGLVHAAAALYNTPVDQVSARDLRGLVVMFEYPGLDDLGHDFVRSLCEVAGRLSKPLTDLLVK